MVTEGPGNNRSSSQSYFVRPSRRSMSSSDKGVIRPVSRSSRSASRFGRQQSEKRAVAGEEQVAEAEHDDAAQSLNVRVKKREPSSNVEESRPRSRLSSMTSIFRSSGIEGSTSVGGSSGGISPAALKSATEQKASELKETLARPLSSLFRRSSKSNDRSAPPAFASQQTIPLAVVPPQQQPPQRTAPTARGPIANQQASGGAGRLGTAAGQRMAPKAGATATANGAPPSTAAVNVSTTATRPFSGFPGRRQPPPAAAQSTVAAPAVGESPATHLETDLSEQAAIAPHVSLRRFSGIIYGAEQASFFGARGGQQRGSARRESSAGRASMGEIDANFLSRFLCPEDEIGDERVAWNWDSLFASVSSELREEWALEEEANNNDLAGAGEMMGLPNGLQPQQQGSNIQQQGF